MVVTSVRCLACLYLFHGTTENVRDRYLAHIPVCPVIAATTTPTSLQAASFLAHPSHGERVEAGDIAVPGAPTGDGGGAFSGVSSPGAAPLFRWIGKRNARPLRWGRL